MTRPVELREVVATVEHALNLNITLDNAMEYEAVRKLCAYVRAELARREEPVAVPVMPGNWPEDAGSENGDYECRCVTCGGTFYGHKRRVICKLCATTATKAPEGWVLVPREPTLDMVTAFHAAAGLHRYSPAVENGLRSAIAAAAPPSAGVGE